MTYKELITVLQALTPEQLDCDVTVEDSYENECYPARLEIASENHDSLEDNYPVILF
jgi:hypothetical protein